MAASLYPPQRPLSIGEIVDTAFRVFRVSVLKCLPYALIAVVAEQLANIYYIVTGRGLSQAVLGALHDPRWQALNIVGLALVMFLCSAMLLRQRALVSGEASTFGAELAAVLQRAPALVLLGILWLVAVFGWFALALLFPSPLRLGVGVVMLVPASIVMVALCAAWPALVLSGRTAVASLTHSWRLTSGSLWRLSAVFTVAIVLVFVLELLITVVTGLGSVLIAHNDLAVSTAVAETTLVILRAILMPFYTALALVVFGDLGVRREGTDLAQRISAAAAG
jgi:hypothetical protein